MTDSKKRKFTDPQYYRLLTALKQTFRDITEEHAEVRKFKGFKEREVKRYEDHKKDLETMRRNFGMGDVSYDLSSTSARLEDTQARLEGRLKEMQGNLTNSRSRYRSQFLHFAKKVFKNPFGPIEGVQIVDAHNFSSRIYLFPLSQTATEWADDRDFTQKYLQIVSCLLGLDLTQTNMPDVMKRIGGRGSLPLYEDLPHLESVLREDKALKLGAEKSAIFGLGRSTISLPGEKENLPCFDLYNLSREGDSKHTFTTKEHLREVAQEIGDFSSRSGIGFDLRVIYKD